VFSRGYVPSSMLFLPLLFITLQNKVVFSHPSYSDLSLFQHEIVAVVASIEIYYYYYIFLF